MSVIWLAPVKLQPSFTISGERFVPQPEHEFEWFRTLLQMQYPRMLMLFKAHLLVSDDSLEACGSDEAELELGGDGSISFDNVSGISLSHCAEAFMDRISSPQEGLNQLGAVVIDETWPAQSAQWLAVMEKWLNDGFQVMLLKEE
jgi:hypothetical protein